MSPESKIDVAVIGAGVIGLAIARLFAEREEGVQIFDAADSIGTGISTRGSHVIHSGIYYPTGSLKAKLCLAGKNLLYNYCDEKNIAHKKIGKIIVATSEEEVPLLEKLKNRGAENGVSDLKWLSAEKVRQMEPEVKCVKGLFSPSTGVIDGQGLMASLLEDAKSHGASLSLSTSIISGEVTDNGIELITINQNGETVKVLCKSVVNSAGLNAVDVAKSIKGIRLDKIPQAYFAKGHYFKLKGPSPFSHLVYPMPVPGGLGTHATLNIKGELRFGPDISWVDKIDYTFEPGKEASFYEVIRHYYPGLPDGALELDHTGIRPKIVPPDSPDSDFLIQGEDEHSVPGLINLFGIESPGFTSSLAIAEEVAKKVL